MICTLTYSIPIQSEDFLDHFYIGNQTHTWYSSDADIIIIIILTILYYLKSYISFLNKVPACWDFEGKYQMRVVCLDLWSKEKQSKLLKGLISWIKFTLSKKSVSNIQKHSFQNNSCYIFSKNKLLNINVLVLYKLLYLLKCF